MKEKPSLVSAPRQLKLVKGQRRSLPGQYRRRDDYSIWEIIKTNIGKDFSRFTVPVFLNEPLCFLQRLSEYLQYSELLDLAAIQPEPMYRIAYVGAFAVSALSANWNRLSKPFNPLLLETFELQKDDVRFVAEQVSHHPPVSAVYAENEHFIIEGTVGPQMSIGMNKLVCIPGASYKVTLKKWNEVYIYDSPKCSIHNVMMGKMYMNLVGNMSVTCSSTNMEMKLNYDGGRGWTSNGSDVHVEGQITRGKEKVLSVYGNWMYYLATCHPDTFKHYHSAYQKVFTESLKPENDGKAALIPDSTILWTANQLLVNADKQFYFSNFTLALNDPALIPANLPPTDCRFRQDLRALEEARNDDAEKFKHLLEECQRTRRKQGIGNTPLWFTRNSEGGWKFTGDYFRRDWSKCTDIFLTNENTTSTTSKSTSSQSSSE